MGKWQSWEKAQVPLCVGVPAMWPVLLGTQEMPRGPSDGMSLRQLKKIVMVIFSPLALLSIFGVKYIISMEFQSIFYNCLLEDLCTVPIWLIWV